MICRLVGFRRATLSSFGSRGSAFGTVKSAEGAIERLFQEATVLGGSRGGGYSSLSGSGSVGPSGSVESYATLDHGRGWRVGFPEVVFGEGKQSKEIYEIMVSLGGDGGQGVLATRVRAKGFEEVLEFAREGGEEGNFSYSEAGRIVVYKKRAEGEAGEDVRKVIESTVAVVTAGTTDIPVAEEAALTLEHTSTNVVRIYDCGVAGLHRIISHLPTLQSEDVDCVIVCAGMDGALPSVVAGLVKCPVIAVPTSVGYGASFGGVAAMLTMLNSCAPGVTVSNIDNGFGAAATAYKLVKRIERRAGREESSD